MGIAPQPGLYSNMLEAPSPLDPKDTVKLGLRSETFRRYRQRGLATQIAQYYGIVRGGLSLAKHVFRGLNRPMMLGEDMHADQSVVVYTWRSLVDAVWVGGRFSGDVLPCTPPPGRVFVVLVREEQPNDQGIFGSIERWNWVREDPELPQAPVAWEQRYVTKLWSRIL